MGRFDDIFEADNQNRQEGNWGYTEYDERQRREYMYALDEYNRALEEERKLKEAEAALVKAEEERKQTEEYNRQIQYENSPENVKRIMDYTNNPMKSALEDLAKQSQIQQEANQQQQQQEDALQEVVEKQHKVNAQKQISDQSATEIGLLSQIGQIFNTESAYNQLTSGKYQMGMDGQVYRYKGMYYPGVTSFLPDIMRSEWEKVPKEEYDKLVEQASVEYGENPIQQYGETLIGLVRMGTSMIPDMALSIIDLARSVNEATVGDDVGSNLAKEELAGAWGTVKKFFKNLGYSLAEGIINQQALQAGYTDYGQFSREVTDAKTLSLHNTDVKTQAIQEKYLKKATEAFNRRQNMSYDELFDEYVSRYPPSLRKEIERDKKSSWRIDFETRLNRGHFKDSEGNDFTIPESELDKENPIWDYYQGRTSYTKSLEERALQRHEREAGSEFLSKIKSKAYEKGYLEAPVYLPNEKAPSLEVIPVVVDGKEYPSMRYSDNKSTIATPETNTWNQEVLARDSKGNVMKDINGQPFYTPRPELFGKMLSEFNYSTLFTHPDGLQQIGEGLGSTAGVIGGMALTSGITGLAGKSLQWTGNTMRAAGTASRLGRLATGTMEVVDAGTQGLAATEGMLSRGAARLLGKLPKVSQSTAEAVVEGAKAQAVYRTKQLIMAGLGIHSESMQIGESQVAKQTFEDVVEYAEKQGISLDNAIDKVKQNYQQRIIEASQEDVEEGVRQFNLQQLAQTTDEDLLREAQALYDNELEKWCVDNPMAISAILQRNAVAGKYAIAQNDKLVMLDMNLGKFFVKAPGVERVSRVAAGRAAKAGLALGIGKTMVVEGAKESLLEEGTWNPYSESLVPGLTKGNMSTFNEFVFNQWTPERFQSAIIGGLSAGVSETVMEGSREVKEYNRNFKNQTEIANRIAGLSSITRDALAAEIEAFNKGRISDAAMISQIAYQAQLENLEKKEKDLKGALKLSKNEGHKTTVENSLEDVRRQKAETIKKLEDSKNNALLLMVTNAVHNNMASDVIEQFEGIREEIMKDDKLSDDQKQSQILNINTAIGLTKFMDNSKIYDNATENRNEIMVNRGKAFMQQSVIDKATPEITRIEAELAAQEAEIKAQGKNLIDDDSYVTKRDALRDAKASNELFVKELENLNKEYEELISPEGQTKAKIQRKNKAALEKIEERAAKKEAKKQAAKESTTPESTTEPSGTATDTETSSDPQIQGLSKAAQISGLDPKVQEEIRLRKRESIEKQQKKDAEKDRRENGVLGINHNNDVKPAVEEVEKIVKENEAKKETEEVSKKIVRKKRKDIEDYQIVYDKVNPQHQKIVDSFTKYLNTIYDRAKRRGTLGNVGFRTFLEEILESKGEKFLEEGVEFFKQAFLKSKFNEEGLIKLSELDEIADNFIDEVNGRNAFEEGSLELDSLISGTTETEKKPDTSTKETIDENAVETKKALETNVINHTKETEKVDPVTEFVEWEEGDFGNRTDPKIPYSSFEYEVTEEKDKYGNTIYVRTEKTGEITKSAIPFVDPTLLKVGTKVTLKAVYSRGEDIIPQWTQKVDGSWERTTMTLEAFAKQLFPDMTFEEFVNTPLKDLVSKNERFLESFPVDLLNDAMMDAYGDESGNARGINDANWFNEYNIGLQNFIAIEERKQLKTNPNYDIEANKELTVLRAKKAQTAFIAESKAKNLAMRRAIVENNGIIAAQVSSRTLGKTMTDSNMNTVASQNPNVTMAVVNQDVLYNSNKSVMVKQDATNSTQMLRNGSVVMVVNNEDGSQSIFMVHTNSENAQQGLREIFKGKKALDKAQTIMRGIKSKDSALKRETLSRYTQAEIDVAQGIYDYFKSGKTKDGKSKPSLDITDGKDMAVILKFFPAPSTISKNGQVEYQKTMDGRNKVDLLRWDYNMKNSDVWENTNNTVYFPKISIVDGKLNIDDSKPYSQVFKENTYTQHRFYQITDNQGNTKYINDVQPVIHLRPLKGEPTISESRTAEAQKKVEEIKKPVKVEVKEKVEETPTGTVGGIVVQSNIVIQMKAEEVMKSQTKPVDEVSNEAEIDKSKINPTVETENRVEEVKENEKPLEEKDLTPKKPAVLSQGQKSRLGKAVFERTLIKLKPLAMEGSPISVKEVYDALVSAYEELVNDFKGTEEERLAIIDLKDDLLGLEGKYRYSVREALSNFLKTEVDEVAEYLEEVVLDEDKSLEKDYDASANEIDVKKSLDIRLKILLSGTKKWSTGNTEESVLGNIEAYEDLNTLITGIQKIFVKSQSNSIGDFISMAKAVLKNSTSKEGYSEYGFLEDVIKNIETMPNDVKRQMQYVLYNNQMDMWFIMQRAQGNYMAMDANSKSDYIFKRQEILANFKNSKIIKLGTEDTFTYNVGEAQKLLDTIKKWQNISNTDISKLSNIPLKEIKEVFKTLGMNFNLLTFEVMLGTISSKDGETIFGDMLKNVELKSMLSSSGLLGVVAKNIENGLKTQKSGKPLSIISSSRNSGNPLLNNNNDNLKFLIKCDNIVSFNKNVSMYVGGKTIYKYEQPKLLGEIMRKLKNKDEKFLNNLRKAQWSQNSMILQLLDNPNFTDNFELIMQSLNVFKDQKSKKMTEGVDELSYADFLVTQFSFFSNTTITPKQGSVPIKIGGIPIRMSRIGFPTISDTGRIPMLNTAVLNIKENHFDENWNLETELLDVIYSQLVEPDLKRMKAYNQGTSESPEGKVMNIEGHNVGANFFTLLPGLNTIMVGEGENRMTLQQALLHNGNFDVTVSQYQDVIRDYINSYFKNKAATLFDVDENGIIKGVFYEKGVITTTANEDGTVKTTINLPQDYLKERAETANEQVQLRVATFDYMINYHISQANMQMLFGGDIANYFKEGMSKQFMDSKNSVLKPDVLLPIMARMAYSSNPEYKNIIADIKNAIATKNTEGLYAKYPLLQNYEEQAYKEVYQGIFDKVSNNLSKRLKEYISPGNRLADFKGQTYRQIALADVSVGSEVLEYLIKLHYPEALKVEGIKNLLSEFKTLDNKYAAERTKEESSRHKELLNKFKSDFPNISGFFETASTDAQEWTTYTEHLDVLKGQGRISDEMYTTVKGKLDRQALSVSKGENIKEVDKLTPEELEKVIFQPIKPLYANLLFEENEDYTAQKFVYVKSSSFPLIPQMTMGMDIDNLRQNIEKIEKEGGKNVRVGFSTAIKVGNVQNPISITELYKKDMDMNKILDSSIELDREGFSIQQDKPYKYYNNLHQGKSNEISRGSQIEKILLGNGITAITDKVFPNLFDKEILEAAGVEEVEGNTSGQDLSKICNELYRQEQELLTTNLLKRFNVKSLEVLQYIDIDNVQFVEELVDTIRPQLTSYQDLDSLEIQYYVDGDATSYSRQQLTERGLTPIRAKTKIPMFLMENSNKMESVINALISKNNAKLKMSGSSSPVATQEGFKFTFQSYEDYISNHKDNGVVFTEAFDGTLKATRDDNGNLVHAQVLISNKMTYIDEKGELQEVNIKDYINKETGLIDNNLLPKEVLQKFSYRIPTSSHQSGILLEVVGFLPKESGDLMIVPKDHTVQIGEDFDIDVRYYYEFNITKKDGKLRPLNHSDLPTKEGVQEIYDKYYEYKQELINEIKGKQQSIFLGNEENIAELRIIEEILATEYSDTIESIFDLFGDNVDKIFGVNRSQEKQELIDRALEFKDRVLSVDQVQGAQKTVREEVQELFKNLKSNLSQEIKDYYKLNSLKGKILQNNIIALYNSVYSTQNAEVRKKIHQVLNTDFAEHTANVLDEVIKQQSDYFSILDPLFQKSVLDLGAAGKMGIGVHSNWVVFNSLIQEYNQQVNAEDRIRLIEERETTTVGVEIKPFYMRFGNLHTRGELGMLDSRHTFVNPNANIPVRTISQINTENQNCATDNQKLQVMGKRNENIHTIGVFSLMCNLGIDQDGVTDLHYPSLFISQPIIKRLVELTEYNSSLVGEKIDIEKKLIEEFGDGVTWTTVYGNPIVGKMIYTAKKYYSQKINSGVLLDEIQKGGTDNSIQWLVYEQFKTLRGKAQDTQKISQAINMSNGLGKSFFNVMQRRDVIASMYENDSVHNIDKLIGDYIDNRELEDEGEYDVPEGYVEIMPDFYVRPNKHTGHRIINSLALGLGIGGQVFPYETPQYQKFIEQLEIAFNVNPGTNAHEEMVYEFLKGLKDYIYVNNLTLFGEINKTRVRLFKGDRSLAKIIQTLRDNNDPIMTDSFFKNLVVKLGSPEEISIVEYNMGERDLWEQSGTNRVLESILNNDTKIAGMGEYKYSDLAKDLLMYSLLSNQENGAIGFRKEIPISYFDKFGVTKALNKFSDINISEKYVANTPEVQALATLMGSEVKDNVINNVNGVDRSTLEDKVGIINRTYKKNEKVQDVLVLNEDGSITINPSVMSVYRNFMVQYIQHNADKIWALSKKDKKELFGNKKISEIDEFEIEVGNPLSERTVIKVVEWVNGNPVPHLFIGREGKYQRHDILGTFGMNEYNPLKIRQKTITPQTVAAKATPTFKQEVGSRPMDIPKGAISPDPNDGVPPPPMEYVTGNKKGSENMPSDPTIGDTEDYGTPPDPMSPPDPSKTKHSVKPILVIGEDVETSKSVNNSSKEEISNKFGTDFTEVKEMSALDVLNTWKFPSEFEGMQDMLYQILAKEKHLTGSTTIVKFDPSDMGGRRGMFKTTDEGVKECTIYGMSPQLWTNLDIMHKEASKTILHEVLHSIISPILNKYITVRYDNTTGFVKYSEKEDNTPNEVIQFANAYVEALNRYVSLCMTNNSYNERLKVLTAMVNTAQSMIRGVEISSEKQLAEGTLVNINEAVVQFLLEPEQIQLLYGSQSGKNVIQALKNAIIKVIRFVTQQYDVVPTFDKGILNAVYKSIADLLVYAGDNPVGSAKTVTYDKGKSMTSTDKEALKNTPPDPNSNTSPESIKLSLSPEVPQRTTISEMIDYGNWNGISVNKKESDFTRYEKMTVKEFLEENKDNEKYSEIIKVISSFGGLENITFKTVNNSTAPKNYHIGKPIIAGYDRVSNTITLNIEQLSGDVIPILLHEIVHSATARMYDMNPLFANKMDLLFRQAQEAGLKDINTDKENGFYGMQDVYEFMAEAFSNAGLYIGRNKDFVSALQGVKMVDDKSLWTKFIELVKSIFGSTSDNNLWEAVISTSLQSKAIAGAYLSKPHNVQRTNDGLVYDNGSFNIYEEILQENYNSKDWKSKPGMSDVEFNNFDEYVEWLMISEVRNRVYVHKSEAANNQDALSIMLRQDVNNTSGSLINQEFSNQLKALRPC